MVRYADDSVLGFQYRADAERFLRDWRERLQQFGLELHPDKTRLIEFGRFAVASRKQRGEGKPETFDFLGFTHIGGQSRKNGKFLVLRKTMRKATSHKAERAKGGASTALARISGGTREMVEERCTGLLQRSCCAREYRQSEKFSARSDAALAAGTPSSWSEASDDVGPPPACGRPLASHSQNPSSVSELAL